MLANTLSVWREYFLDKVKFSLAKVKLPDEILGKKVLRYNKMDGVKMITKNFWLMLRPSGTEPIVRVYAESRSRKLTQELLDIGKKIIYAV